MALAIVLLSGGLDSTTALAIAAEKGYGIVALTFDYGQRHDREVESARRVAEHYGVKRHIVIDLDIGGYLSSSLTDASQEVPTDGLVRDGPAGIPNTYVPGRNMVFLSLAAAIAEGIGAESVFVAANAVDYSGYPDCTPEFLEAFQETLAVGTKRGVEGRPVRVDAPLLRLSKAEIVREAVRLDAPLDLTWSCYRGGNKACGVCDSCRLRLNGFKEAGESDPLEYDRGDDG
ncbi:MAG: 7-cyano-7-deazaguanine synthase QueC [Thermoplasmata archaeon]|nr:7-cyano-7-deazaguanine synthase QueC [Thermoplasmata archaeon]